MASELAIYYTPMHFMWGVKSGATPGPHSLDPPWPADSWTERWLRGTRTP